MQFAIFTAIVAVVFLCIGYGFGYSTKVGQNALRKVVEVVSEAMPKPQDEEKQRGFYER
jgi:hypothetical protein